MVEKSHKKQAHIPVFSRTFDEIPVYSRPGILIIKFQYFPGFPGSVRTLNSNRQSMLGDLLWPMCGSLTIDDRCMRATVSVKEQTMLGDLLWPVCGSLL